MEFEKTIIIIIIINIIVIGFIIYDFKTKDPIISNGTQSLKPQKSLLERVLIPEIVKIPEGNCLTYATHYNKTLSEKYPDLNIRWPRKVDICNNLTLCDNYHTFLIVSGYGGECILDQSNLVCVDIIKTNLTKEEVDKLEW